MELNDVLRKVRALADKAAHPATPPAEAEAAGKMADSLMMKYAIDEAILDKSRPAPSRAKPDVIEVALVSDYEFVGYLANLASQVARHCNCRIREYGGGYHDGAYHSKVYGYESDLRYFEIMYTTLRLHMVGALRPGIDQNKSIDDNAYALHNAGLNWQDIAILYGWKEVLPEPGEAKTMYEHKTTLERGSYAKVVLKYKNAYKRAIQARGEKELRIPPSGMHTFQRSSADGYANRIAQRLRQIRDGRQIGTELAMRMDDLDALFKEQNPDLFRPASAADFAKGRSFRYKTAPFSESAYRVGVQHANGANLNPAASHNPTKEVQ